MPPAFEVQSTERYALDIISGFENGPFVRPQSIRFITIQNLSITQPQLPHVVGEPSAIPLYTGKGSGLVCLVLPPILRLFWPFRAVRTAAFPTETAHLVSAGVSLAVTGV